MTFCKYEFPEKRIWDNLKDLIKDGTEYTECSVVEIGHICLEQDKEGNCIDEDLSYAVDIMWSGNILDSFNEYEVFPNPVGIHTFYGCEGLYTKRFCEFNPQSEYCITPKEITDETSYKL
jgi:hypothetical protein